MQEKPRYSIVTAVHNALEYNKLYYESLKENSAYPFELIVIDNASSDGSGEYFKEQGVTVIRNDDNRNYSAVQNQGLEAAQCDIIAFFNNDIVPSKDWDKRVIGHMERYSIDMISPVGIENMETDKLTRKARRRWRNINLLQRIKVLKDMAYTHKDLAKLVKRMYGNYDIYTEKRYSSFKQFIYPGFAGNAVITHRRLFDKVGLWNTEVSAADWDLNLRTVKRAVEHQDVMVPMVAGDSFIHHFVSATAKKKAKDGSNWNNLKSIDDCYSKEDLRYLNRPKASLIIAVYNHIADVEKVFQSLLDQTEKDFEVVISDDGSSDDYTALIQRYQSNFKYPIQHIYHGDNGFQKTIIANKSAMAARSEYLIFIDGDCILHSRFIERHIKRARVGTVQAGRRIMLSLELTERIKKMENAHKQLEKSTIWKNNLDEREGKAKYGYFRPWAYPLLQVLHKKYDILGSNYSLYKGDFIRVNGYDEQVIGRGLEDNNLSNRLKRAGVRICYISFEAIQYHLHHTFEPIAHSKEVIERLGNPKEFWAEDGIIKK